MSEKFLVGIDLGTQSAKIVVYDSNGRSIVEKSEKLRPLELPGPQLAIHPDDDIWDSLKTCSQRVMKVFLEELNLSPDQIIGVGICIIRCCRTVLDASGKLTYPVINWMDKRMDHPYEHEDSFGKVSYVTTSSGYITHRLTGQTRDTCANYIGPWPLDQDTCDWSKDPQIIEKFNIPREQLFDLVKPGETLGHVTEEASRETFLPKGVPVIATAHDKAVEALGAGLIDQNRLLISLGTYIGAMVLGTKNVKDSKAYWPFLASIPHKYLYECMGVRRGMWTVSWFCQQFGEGTLREAEDRGLSIEDYFNQLAENVPAGSDGLITVHDWAAPPEAPYRKGVMLGFDGRHNQAHIYRSILEGIAYRLKTHILPMIDELNLKVEELVITGGGSNSQVFMQIFADIFNIPVMSKPNGSASIGCIINTGVGLGIWKSYEQAHQVLNQPGTRFYPMADNVELYEKIYRDVYLGLHKQLDPPLEKLSGIVD